MSHPEKLFNGGSGGFGFEFALGLGERFTEGAGFSVNELLERTRPDPRRSRPPSRPPFRGPLKAPHHSSGQ